MEIILIILGIIFVTIIAFLYSIYAWGFVLWKFWYWFLLPVFPIAGDINIYQCIGLMMIISLFKTTPAQVVKDEYVSEYGAQILQLIYPPIVLTIGWLVKTFVLP